LNRASPLPAFENGAAPHVENLLLVSKMAAPGAIQKNAGEKSKHVL
jgi:hypothetical protein